MGRRAAPVLWEDGVNMSVVFPNDLAPGALVGWLDHSDPEVRAGVYRALRAHGAAAVKALLEAQATTHGPARRRLVDFRRRLVDRLIDEWLARRPNDPRSVTP